MFSKFFIDRPIFATVVAIIMVFIGGLTLFTLPVAQFPDITPPTIQVTASYPGANAETVAKTVGVPIEAQVNGVEGMMYMSSTSSSDGTYNLTITFELGTDVDMATVMVQNRVAIAEASLPEAVIQQGITTEKQSTNIVLFIALQGDKRYSSLYLSNYASISISDELARVSGVGGVTVFGAGSYSMRVWLDPEVMRVRSVTPADVQQAIIAQNMEVAAGSVGAAPTSGNEAFQFTLTTKGRLVTSEEFGNIIIRTNGDGSYLRLKDIGRIDLGSVSYSTISSVNGEDAALIAIYQLPGANALDVANNVLNKMDELTAYFPSGVYYETILNTTDFVSASIDEVFVTLVEATIIVMLVILLFLQNWRAVIIPMITIPVSLIATFAVMKLLGFTINTLTLFGLVLAIAIVVDDAIVVVEDVSRLLSTGKYNRYDATVKSMKELQSPLIGEVLVLMAVFIPTAFISGITGELYKQFALTIAVSTAFSGINALTLTPALCALILKPAKNEFFVYRYFNKYFNKTLNGYTTAITHILRRPVIAFIVFLGLTGLAFFGYAKWPSSYVPNEDLGYFITSVQLPSGASLERSQETTEKVMAMIKELPQVKDVITLSGMSVISGGTASNMGTLFVVLNNWNERKGYENSVFAIIDKVNIMTSSIEEAIIFSINPPAIPGLGTSGGLELALLDINNLGADEMTRAIGELEVAVAANDKLASIQTLYEGTVPQYQLNIDRNKVEMQQLNLSSVFSALSLYMGQSYVNDFVDFGRIFQVRLSAEALSRSNIGDVLKLSVRNSEGKMVPFSSFTTIEPTMGLSVDNRYNMYSSASLTFNTKPNISSNEGIKATEEVITSTLGNSYGYSWTGQAYQENQSGASVVLVLILAIIVTILVLAAQYESWTDPIAVVLSMPIAILGTVLGAIVMGQSISIYTQIGIILILGLSAKNAILIVEYAVDFRHNGETIRNAAIHAGRIRFRPIVMTAIAFVVGVMPMMLATGAGAESRISLGTAVVFGMAVNALIGTLLIPNFWELMENIRERYLMNLFKDDTVTTANDDELDKPQL